MMFMVAAVGLSLLPSAHGQTKPEQCEAGLESQAKPAGWRQRVSQKFNGLLGNKEKYYSLKLAHQTLYHPIGAAPIDERLSKYFPNFLEELDQKAQRQSPQPSLTAQTALIPEQLEVASYIAGTQEDHLSDQEFEAFRQRVMALADLRRDKGGDGRTGSAAFKKWLPAALEQYRKKNEMERLLTVGGGGHTFRTFFDVELRQRFDKSGYLSMSNTEKCVYKAITHPALHVPLLATWKVGRFVAAGIAGVAIFSTCQNTWNSFTGAPQAVVTQKAAQVGAQMFTPVTNGLQFLVINSSAVATVAKKQEQVKKLANEIDNVKLDDLVGLKPEVAEAELKKRMSAIRHVAEPVAEFVQKEYAEFNDLLKLAVELRTQEGAFLPGDQNGGRGIFWANHLFVPQDIAFRIAGFETNYNTHELLIHSLQERLEKLEAEKADVKKIEKVREQIAAHEKSKEVAMQQAAGTLALIHMVEFMYPELFNKTLNDKDHQAITGAYHLMKQRFGFDHYIKSYQKHAHETVLEIHRFLSLRRAALESALGAKPPGK